MRERERKRFIFPTFFQSFFQSDLANPVIKKNKWHTPENDRRTDRQSARDYKEKGTVVAYWLERRTRGRNEDSERREFDSPLTHTLSKV